MPVFGPRTSLQLLASLGLLVASVSSISAGDVGGCYRSAYFTAGFLLRAATVCQDDPKRTINVAFRIVSAPELKAMSKFDPEITEKWMKEGADYFDDGEMDDGVASACAYAKTARARAEDVARKRR